MSKSSADIAREKHEKWIHKVANNPSKPEEFLSESPNNLHETIKENFENRKKRLQEKGLWVDDQ